MTDRKDSEIVIPVGLTDEQMALVRAHDEAEDLAVALGKTFHVTPFDPNPTFYAMKPSEFAARGGTSLDAVMSLFDRARPGTTVLFTDGLPDESIADILANMPVPDGPDFSAHYEAIQKAEPGVNWRDAFHEHLRAAVKGEALNDESNERKYPDLMKRLDALRKLTDGE